MKKNEAKKAKPASCACADDCAGKEAKPASCAGEGGAKWGTVRWVTAWPYSRCDRRRKARIAKAVGEGTLKKILEHGPCLCEWGARLKQLCDEYGVSLAKKDAGRYNKAYGLLTDYCETLRDACIASALCKAWGIEDSLEARKTK